MANTTIKIPYLTPGLTYTVDVVDPLTGSVLQSGIALTLTTDITGATGSGTVTAAIDAKCEFVVKTGSIIVEVRVRTIADDVGPYRIVTGLDTASGGTVSLVDPDAEIDCATGWIICVDEFCQPENGVDITIRLTAGNGVAGVSLDTAERTVTSATVEIDGEDVVGYVAFPGLAIAASYSIIRGETQVVDAASFANLSASPAGSFVVPTEFADPAAPSFAIPQVIGSEPAA